MKLGLNRTVCIDSYKAFDTIVNVSSATKNIFDGIVPNFKQKSEYIHNTFNTEEILRLSKEKNPFDGFSGCNFVTVCRIENKSKRIDRIVKVCKMLREESLSDFVWYIVGDGVDFDKVRILIDKHDLNDVVYMEGKQSNPYIYIKNADFCVISSEYEAYPMVVTESLILKTPVIATAYAAVNEQVEHNFNGIIVDNSTNGLYKAVRNVLINKEIKERLRNNIMQTEITNDLSMQKFFDIIGFEPKTTGEVI